MRLNDPTPNSVMAEVSYTRTGVREIVFHLPGGTLTMTETSQAIRDEFLEVAGAVVTKREFNYSGYLPREIGLALVRALPDQGGTIAGKSLLEWLEAL